MTKGEIYFLVIFPIFTTILFFLPWIISKVSKSLNKCEHRWEFYNEFPYSVIYGFGELKCNKCQKVRTSWDLVEILTYKIISLLNKKR